MVHIPSSRANSGSTGTLARQALSLEKRAMVRDDGRYLIYYTFARRPESGTDAQIEGELEGDV